MHSLKVLYIKYQIVNFYRLIQKKLKHFSLKSLKSYAGKPMLTAEEGNQLIKNALLKGKPFVAGRYGANEVSVTREAIEIDMGFRKEVRDERMVSLCRNAGFFPKDAKLGYRFGKMQAELSQDVDLLGVFGWRMEDFAINSYAHNANVCIPHSLEPYYSEQPWTSALKGKKVLVIHPFEDTIIRQYKKRELLFDNPDILPEFELKTLKAVQSAAFCETSFGTWFDALDYMFEEAMKIDFDVAIIGCGAYGLSLACMLKKAGKMAIHMGGATQILFGIKGNRWDNHPVISKLYNEHWTRPSQNETPKKADQVEGACYW